MTGGGDLLLQTAAVQAAAEFYEQHLGLRRMLEQPDLIGLDAGAFTLYLDRGPSLGPVLEFFVPDVAEARARLLAAGCVVVQEDPAIPRLYLRDPYGLVFNLHERGRAPDRCRFPAGIFAAPKYRGLSTAAAKGAASGRDDSR